MAFSERDTLDIPARTLLRAAEVCQMAGLQPYVLRSWEAEFPSLGVARVPGGDRVYRRRDVERVMEIKELVFTEGLTLAGVRRRLGDDVADRDAEVPELTDVLGAEVKAQVDKVKASLRGLLALLADDERQTGGDGAGGPVPATPPRVAKTTSRRRAPRRKKQ